MTAKTRNASPRRFGVSMIVMALACVSASAAFAAAPAKNGPAAASTKNSTPASAPANATPASTVTAGSVTTLRQLMDDHQLAEIRTTYNGTYGASLLFQADKLTYYIALFHGKEFWRVMQTDSFEDAEKVYRTFASQTQELASVEIDAMRLDAGNKYAAKMIAQNEERLQGLQKDAAYQQQQARQVATLQEQAKQQAATLSSDLRSTSSQLDSMKRRISTLEAQQSDPTLVLPAPETQPAPATAPVDPAPASTASTGNVSH
ncbi:DUF2968 domain-containing protein [Dyella sp. 20L07]|uniref:DUF2968 domain-containing protein n=1 Tax=Dyella sp. 20L07 TaxID=3384240 RepID=UPI003D277E98